MAELSSQQAQTLSYFNKVAQEWDAASSAGRSNRVNIIAQRNGVVLDVLAERESPARLLDVGCGSGQLVLAATEAGHDALGIDFAADMIAACEANRVGTNARAARFEQVSIQDFQAPGGSFDIVSGLGLIEYLSLQEFDQFCTKASVLLSNGGTMLVGSRNRLFNAFSLNAFTNMERELGTLDALLGESELLATTDCSLGLANAEAVARALPQPKSHPGTGIGVSIRYQFTPGELVQMLRKHGFAPVGLVGIHYHGLPPQVANEWPTLHVQLSNAVYAERRKDLRLIPQSSSFVLHVCKTK